MAITLPDARHLSDEVLEALRLRAVRGCELGFTEADVADLLGVARETVSRWWTAYRSGGAGGLPGDRTGRPPGSGRTLSDGQGEHIQQLIDNHSPEELGIRRPLWSRAAVRELIRKEFGIDMPVRTVGEYLGRWGYTAKRPTRHARDQDPDEVERWLTETYPRVLWWARRDGATVLWCDEVGVAADEFTGKGYARRGRPAVVEVPRPHIRVNVISATGAAGVVRFMTYRGGMNAALFVVFLGRLLRTVPGKVYLIADRLPAHQAEVVQRWLAEHRDRIRVVWLPRYSPELNPVEYLNNDLKGRVKAAELPGSWQALRSRIRGFLHGLVHRYRHVMSYFWNPHVQYASSY